MIGRFGINETLFSTVIVDCEAVVYLDISDARLMEHCRKRGVEYAEAISIKEAIEGDWNAHRAIGDKVFYYVMMTE